MPLALNNNRGSVYSGRMSYSNPKRNLHNWRMVNLQVVAFMTDRNVQQSVTVYIYKARKNQTPAIT